MFCADSVAVPESPWIRRLLGAVGVVLTVILALAIRRRRALGLVDGVKPDRPGPRAHQPSRPDGTGVRMIVNPGSGPMLSGDPTPVLEEGLPAAELIELTEDLDLEKVLKAPGAEVLGAAGGDGTINFVAGIAMEEGLPLMVAPAGTFNHLCLDAQIESVEAAVSAVKEGKAVKVDVGLIDGKVFMNTATVGSYVELVDARQRYEGRIGKPLALVVAAIQVLHRGEPIDLEIDGRNRRVWLLFVGNGAYHPHGMIPVGRPRLDDGLLDMRLVDGTMRWSRARLVLALLTGRITRTPVYEERRTDRIRVSSRSGPMRVAIDGETCDVGEEFDIEKRPLALTLFTPAEPEDD